MNILAHQLYAYKYSKKKYIFKKVIKLESGALLSETPGISQFSMFKHFYPFK